MEARVVATVELEEMGEVTVAVGMAVTEAMGVVKEVARGVEAKVEAREAWEVATAEVAKEEEWVVVKAAVAVAVV